ncbi:MAG: FtsX-like permease family protein [Pirellulales bacterium]|nr:FtsX-like permease family protein [Pirellulales bacterium]
MKVLDRKLLREARGHLGMLLAVGGIIVVGVTCLVTMVSAYINLADAKQLYYSQCRMADFSVELRKAPLAELKPLEEMPEVAKLRPRIQHAVTVDLPGMIEPIIGQVYSLPDRRRPVINDIVIREGSYFTARRDNEVIVNEKFAEAHRLRPGQWIRMLLNNQQQELFIVGTAISSEFVYLIGPGAIVPDDRRFGVFYMKRTYAEEVFDFEGSANQVLGRLSAAAGGDPREVLRRAEEMLAPYGVFTTTPLEDQLSNKFLTQEIQGLETFAVVTPCIFLAVAALVLNVLLARLAQQQRIVVGTLKALGYGDLQIFWHFLKFGLIVGVAGGLLGCGLGWWLARLLTDLYSRFYQFPELPSRPYWGVFAIGMLVSTGCAALGSFRGSRAVLRLHPAEAMRPSPPRRGGAILIERVGWLWRSLGSGWRMVLRNATRSRLRTAACVFAAAMGACVLINAFMMQLSIDELIDFQFHRIMRSDVDLTFNDERGRDALDEAVRLPGVDRAEPTLNVACTFINGWRRKKGAVTGLIRDAVLTVPRDAAGRRLRIPARGLVMSRQLADALGVGRGSLVGFEPVKGQKRLRYVPVVEISDSYLGTAVYADIKYLSRLVYEEYAVSGVQLAVQRDPASRGALYRALKNLPAVQTVAARADMIENLETVLETQSIFILLLVLFAGIVFFGSILNASLVSLAERQREVATLRVLGYGPWRVGGLLFRESMITTILGTLLGMPLGYLLMLATAEAYASDLFRMPIVAAPELWILTMVTAIIFGLITHLFVQRSINKMDWLDALKIQE